MKPDQHKLKKNAVYKKKHGISGDKPLADKNTPQENEPHASQNSSKNNESRPGARLKHTSAPYSSSDESVDDKVSASFARRKVESNWQKYEIDIGAVEDTLRGADYNELLQSTRKIFKYLPTYNATEGARSKLQIYRLGIDFNNSATWFEFESRLGISIWITKYGDILGNVLPHYQFGTFQAVAEEEHQTLAGDDNWLEKFVALDCEHLAAAFLCVPLQQRLDIDDSMFEKSSLDTFNHDAALHLCAYRETFCNLDTRTSHDRLCDTCFSLPAKAHEICQDSVKEADTLVQTEDLSVEENHLKELDEDPIQFVNKNQVSENCLKVDGLMPGVPHSIPAESSNETSAVGRTTNEDLDASKQTYISTNEKTIEELELELDSLLSI